MPPIYHRARDSIEARRTIVFAGLAVSRWIGKQTGRAAQVRPHRPPLPHSRDPGRPRVINTADLLPDDLRSVIDRMYGHSGPH
jgi:hypothetical protein